MYAQLQRQRGMHSGTTSSPVCSGVQACTAVAACVAANDMRAMVTAAVARVHGEQEHQRGDEGEHEHQGGDKGEHGHQSGN